MAFEAEYVKYEVDGHVATITMNRPERLNAFGSPLANDLGGAWAEAVGDDHIRVVVLAGEGRIFCAGRDIKEQAERGGGARVRSGGDSILGFYYVPDTDKPIISAVQGGAWGAGWYMCCGSDIVVAADDARFAMAELPTGVIGPAFVPILNNLPWLPGSEIVLRGHQITAQRAYELGLVNHVVPAAELMTTARELADELAGLPPVHVQVTKRQLMMARPRPTTYQHAIALPQALDGLFKLEDTKEAAEAFAEKRKPIFKGR